MIDLHCHLLPGVDDGAADVEESVAMARLAAAAGTTVLVATPHLRHELFENRGRRRLEALHAELVERLDGVLDVRLGGEIAVHSDSFDEMLELPGGDLLTLAGSRYVLVELPWRPIGVDPFAVVHELTVRGLVPIVAHPERVRWLAEDLALVTALHRRGARMQLTGLSVTGALGPFPERASRAMLDAGIVDFVASDAHGTEVRTPALRDVHRYLVASRGEETARRLLVDNPAAVVADRPLAAVGPVPTVG